MIIHLPKIGKIVIPYYCNALSKISPDRVFGLVYIFYTKLYFKKDNFLSVTMELKLFFIKYLDILDK